MLFETFDKLLLTFESLFFAAVPPDVRRWLRLAGVGSPLNSAKGCALSQPADEAEPQQFNESLSERHSLSAHQAAQPR